MRNIGHNRKRPRQGTFTSRHQGLGGLGVTDVHEAVGWLGAPHAEVIQHHLLARSPEGEVLKQQVVSAPCRVGENPQIALRLVDLGAHVGELVADHHDVVVRVEVPAAMPDQVHELFRELGPAFGADHVGRPWWAA